MLSEDAGCRSDREVPGLYLEGDALVGDSGEEIDAARAVEIPETFTGDAARGGTLRRQRHER